MFVIANRIPVAKDWHEEFENRFRKRAGEISSQPGFVSMQILKPLSDNAPYVVLTHWENETAFDDWIQSDDFKLAHQNPLPKEAFISKPVMEKYSVVITS